MLRAGQLLDSSGDVNCIGISISAQYLMWCGRDFYLNGMDVLMIHS